jgi:ABC-type antimicrobial peptide transport system permease subunit
MLEQFRFYLKHSLNDLMVNKKRTFFALLCIAAGVAAIVSLQTLGVMINNTLTSGLQEANQGDVRVEYIWQDVELERGKEAGVLEVYPDDEDRYYFSEQGISMIQSWLDEAYPGSEITYRQEIEGAAGFVIRSVENGNVKMPVLALVVDADVYPFYGERTSLDAQPLSELLQSSTDLVMSESLVDDLELQVGDTVRVAGINADLTVRGIVSDAAEGGIDATLWSIFGYFYLDYSVMEHIDNLVTATMALNIKLADPTQTVEASQALTERFPYLDTTTTFDLRDQNSLVSNVINDLVTIMGLISLLIGGIGIINTMLVTVSRRTTEVAVLKTLGLEPEKVSWLFMVEAFLMGLIGSSVGILLGWLLAFLTKGYAEQFLAQGLDFEIAIQPAVNGFIVGVITTCIFGFLPILAAGQIRPVVVLRPSEIIIPRAGRLFSLVALLAMIMALSLVARSLIGTLFTGDTYRYMAAANGLIFAGAIGVSMVVGGMYTYLARRNVFLRIIRWGILLVLLPVLGATFGYVVPTLLMITVTFLGVGLLYVWLWGLIWAVGGGTLAELPFLHRIPAKSRSVALGLLVLISLVVLVIAYLLWSGNLGDVSPSVLGFSLVVIIPFNGVLLPVILVWGLGRLIQYIGFVDLRIAMRSMLADKRRVASTLLALVIGVLTLSLITMLVTSIVNVFDEIATDLVGGNVVIYGRGSQDTLEKINGRLETAPGVRSYTTVADYNVKLLYVEHADGSQETYEELYRKAEEESINTALIFDSSFETINGRGLDSNLPDIKMAAGRQLVPTDAGTHVIVIGASDATKAAGIQVGDRLTFALLNQDKATESETPTLTFEVVGMTDSGDGTISVVTSGNYVPIDAFPAEYAPNEIFAVVDVEEAEISNLRSKMNEVSGAYMIETKLFNEVITSILDKFTAFPILVAGLALLTGGIVIANSVALSTMERRREIGIMKAIGIQRERVLGMLLLENALTGVIGGLIGVGISVILLLAIFIGVFKGELGTGVPLDTAFLLMGLCLGISLLAAMLTVWGASGEKPMNVLRYE